MNWLRVEAEQLQHSNNLSCNLWKGTRVDLHIPSANVGHMQVASVDEKESIFMWHLQGKENSLAY